VLARLNRFDACFLDVFRCVKVRLADVLNGAQQVLGLLLPYLKPQPKAQLMGLLTVYQAPL
jgi:hypothetical protein